MVRRRRKDGYLDRVGGWFSFGHDGKLKLQRGGVVQSKDVFEVIKEGQDGSQKSGQFSSALGEIQVGSDEGWTYCGGIV